MPGSVIDTLVVLWLMAAMFLAGYYAKHLRTEFSEQSQSLTEGEG